jgi:phosphoglucomutase
MSIHKLAGKKPKKQNLENIPKLISEYYVKKPDFNNENQRISFGTSGHRGSSFDGTFNENHILATVQAICDYRKENKIQGPLFLGKDTHALSEPAFITAIEVLSANEITTFIQVDLGYTPTPVISHAILNYNNKNKLLADGIVITPSHNPPRDGGIKYNPPNGGPASENITSEIAKKANDYLDNKIHKIPRINFEKAMQSSHIKKYDFIRNYVNDLENVIDLDIIRKENPYICADAMGGSGFAYWEAIAETYKLNMDIRNNFADSTFSFMTLDKDGKIRMDCSSKYAMKSMIGLKNKYDIAFGNDPDFDRHGIVVPDKGLLNPNHYLSVCIDYLFKNRKNWNENLSVGKTLVSSSIIDKIAKNLNKKVFEVPVGFKWFVEGLYQGHLGFGGEESAGASFLRKNGKAWTTDKDGIILNLLAVEILATTGKSPGKYYDELTEKLGNPFYIRIDAPANKENRQKLKRISLEDLQIKTIANEKITSILTKAPGNNMPIGGFKINLMNGWFAARPSGTEDIYKIYAESFISAKHLKLIVEDAQKFINKLFE